MPEDIFEGSWEDCGPLPGIRILGFAGWLLPILLLSIVPVCVIIALLEIALP